MRTNRKEEVIYEGQPLHVHPCVDELGGSVLCEEVSNRDGMFTLAGSHHGCAAARKEGEPLIVASGSTGGTAQTPQPVSIRKMA